MNNEFIALIIGFGTSIVILVFATIAIVLLLKRTTHKSGLNDIVYDAEQMKESFNKYCTADAIKTKGTIEHPSTFESDNDELLEKIMTFFVSLNEKAEDMWNVNRAEFLKRDLTCEEACKETYKIGVRHILAEICGDRLHELHRMYGK